VSSESIALTWDLRTSEDPGRRCVEVAFDTVSEGHHFDAVICWWTAVLFQDPDPDSDPILLSTRPNFLAMLGDESENKSDEPEQPWPRDHWRHCVFVADAIPGVAADGAVRVIPARLWCCADDDDVWFTALPPTPDVPEFPVLCKCTWHVTVPPAATALVQESLRPEGQWAQVVTDELWRVAVASPGAIIHVVVEFVGNEQVQRLVQWCVGKIIAEVRRLLGDLSCVFVQSDSFEGIGLDDADCEGARTHVVSVVPPFTFDEEDLCALPLRRGGGGSVDYTGLCVIYRWARTQVRGAGIAHSMAPARMTIRACLLESTSLWRRWQPLESVLGLQYGLGESELPPCASQGDHADVEGVSLWPGRGCWSFISERSGGTLGGSASSLRELQAGVSGVLTARRRGTCHAIAIWSCKHVRASDSTFDDPSPAVDIGHPDKLLARTAMHVLVVPLDVAEGDQLSVSLRLCESNDDPLEKLWRVGVSKNKSAAGL
jgi:hypothetical protein